MTLKTIPTLTIIATLIILSAGCINNSTIEPESEYVFVAQTPRIPAATPIPIELVECDIIQEDIVSNIPNNYYSKSESLTLTDEGFITYLDKFSWKRAISHSGGWSFREAAELEHDLTEMGYNITIRLADCKTTIDHSEFATRTKTDGYDRWAGLPELDQVSCWIMIEMNGEMVAYDPTYCYWIYKPDHVNKDDYAYHGKYHSWWYYKENTTAQRPGITWTSHNFIDFNNIYEIEDYYMSGEMQIRYNESNMNGIWWSYFNSAEYNTTDDFLITFGWWLPEDELDDIETRINRATDWYVCGE